MAKQKIGIGYRILHVFTFHPWLKLVSLILALILWLYIKEAMFIPQ